MKMRTVTIGDIGDIDAPPGSKPWAVSMRLELQRALEETRYGSEHVKRMVDLMREHHGYKQLVDARGNCFTTYESFCTAERPFGLGYQVEDIDRIIGERRQKELADLAREVEPAKGHGGERKGEVKQGVVNTLTRGSTNASTIMARLKRDALTDPKAKAILGKVERGEIQSARQAGIQAGFIREPTALEQLQRWWRKATPEERAAFLKEVQ